MRSRKRATARSVITGSRLALATLAPAGTTSNRVVPPLIPAQAGIQSHELRMWPWIPACAGTSGRGVVHALLFVFPFHPTIHSTPLRCAAHLSPRFSSFFLLPAPVKGWAERREARIFL